MTFPGLTLHPSAIQCPKCGHTMDSAKTPQKLSETLWNGWVCEKCGSQIDRFGMIVKMPSVKEKSERECISDSQVNEG